jgi:hypothetical protein
VQRYVVRKAVGEVGIAKAVGEVGIAKALGEVGIAKAVGEIGIAKAVGEVGIAGAVGEVGVHCCRLYVSTLRGLLVDIGYIVVVVAGHSTANGKDLAPLVSGRRG